MNFAVMPELTWIWGYPFALGLMLAISSGLVVFFRSRKWW
jgi:magnesium transporter